MNTEEQELEAIREKLLEINQSIKETHSAARLGSLVVMRKALKMRRDELMARLGELVKWDMTANMVDLPEADFIDPGISHSKGERE